MISNSRLDATRAASQPVIGTTRSRVRLAPDHLAEFQARSASRDPVYLRWRDALTGEIDEIVPSEHPEPADPPSGFNLAPSGGLV